MFNTIIVYQMTSQSDLQYNTLLREIKKNLRRGDQAEIAENLDISRAAVSDVVNGKEKSERVLAHLHQRAMENKCKLENRINALKPSVNE